MSFFIGLDYKRGFFKELRFNKSQIVLILFI